TLADANAYADVGDARTLATATAHSDAGNAQTLSDSRAYTTAKAAQTLQTANTYADTGDAATLQSANIYTDQQVARFNHGLDEFRMEMDDRFHTLDRRIDRMGATSAAYAGLAANTAG